MLGDMTSEEWLAFLGLPESRIPQALILRGSRNLTAQCQKHKGRFGDVLELALNDTFVGNLRGRTVAYGSVYGAPMAAEIVHVFGTLGTRLVVQTGCCGALVGTIEAGDLIVATEAYCGEGASQYYRPGLKIVSASPELTRWPGFDEVAYVHVHLGKVYTTSALFAERTADIQRWVEAGCVAVDMETAATFAVADYFGMTRVAILHALDRPTRGERIYADNIDRSTRRRRHKGNDQMIELALRLVIEHSTPRQ